MRKIIGILSILLAGISLFAQNDNCYAYRLAKGDSLFAVRMYKDALNYYVAATSCVNKPEDLSELNTKIERTQKEIDESKKPKIFVLSKNDVLVESDGAKGNIDVTLKRINRWGYEEKDCPSWVSITKTKKGFIYECQPNNQPLERTCSIKFKAGAITQIFTIHQEKAKEFLTLSPTYIRQPSQGGTQVVSVKTNALSGFDVTSKLTWATTSFSQDNVTIVFDENKKHDPRSGIIFVRTKSCVESIRVIQEAKPSNFLLDIVAMRILSDFELSMSFRLKNGDHIQFDAGFWDILRYKNLSGGFAASYIWTYNFSDIWSLHYGIGLGIGGVRRPYDNPNSRFVVAAVPSVAVEFAPKGWEIAGKQVGITVDYRPYIGTDCVGFYHNLTNFNLGVRLHLH